ncbi:MAG: hypothetical protein KAK00_00865 [Nanoarchaeota archaeon]|nr:hypothetical protein [Nanoarchaeota archaeon]
MSSIKKEVYRDLLSKYKSRIEGQLEGHLDSPISTKDYQDFKKEIIPPHMTKYEEACNFAEKILKIKPDEKKASILQDSINSAHINITPSGAVSLGIFLPLLIILFGGILAFAVLQSMMFVVIVLILGAILIKPLSDLPNYIANYWRLKASNQMVLCVFYVVTYMRHTSNLENAIQFASEHLTPPLSLDMKKIIWDVETEKFDSLKDSLDYYLDSWRKYNMEFVESFHLIESSLLEGDETRRLAALDKSLDVILEETYEKMLHYAHNLKSPITMLHMLGIILPILGLVILPLVISFLEGVSWLHLMFFYNIVLPIGVYSMGRIILTKRPTGYGDTDISEENPSLKKYKNIIINIGNSEIRINPFFLCIFVGALLFIIGISPIIIHTIAPSFDFPADPEAQFHLIEYNTDKLGNLVGPFGIGSSVLSLFVTLAFGIGFGLYFKLRSKNLIKIRERAKKLEDEFASALFQLGNRLGDDIPAEMAFGRVAEYMQDTNSGKFFRLVSINIQKMGMSVNQAIFDKQHGALLYFPSKIIESSMKVLIESIKKGPRIAAQALTNIARYIKEIHRVNERLRDLMADIISSMTSQIKFLTPAIAGIVVGITSMITTILSKLSKTVSNIGVEGVGGVSAPMDMAEMFGMGIPTFYFQIVVGIYVVQIIYILTVLSNGIQNGSDKLNENYQLGINLINGTILYCFISLFVMVLFNNIASTIMDGAL